LEQISKASQGLPPDEELQTAEQSTGEQPTSGGLYVRLKSGAVVDNVPPEVVEALKFAGLIKIAAPAPRMNDLGPPSIADNPGSKAAQAEIRTYMRRTNRAERRLGPAIKNLDKAAGADPRVPLSTCDGGIDYHPRGVDLLVPIQLAHLSSEQSLLAGPVTLVGKRVRAVRKPGQAYVDDASFATYDGPATAIDDLTRILDGYPLALGIKPLVQELTADAVVLAPGAVILPIAIYK
jgi:hypothetical protein